MNSLTVIIPSKTITNLMPCIEAVRVNEPNARIIVIDDGLYGISADGTVVTILPGIKPFVFARNMNIGILAALADSDIVLLNDDALLKSPAGFTHMQCAAEANPQIGIIGAVTNVTGQPLQRPAGVGLRQVPGFAFVCVLIPRRTLDLVGMLDERFVTYGWEDNDYCHRVQLAGLQIAVHDDCYVDHGSLKSTFRGDPRAAGNIYEGREIFRQKWGFAP